MVFSSTTFLFFFLPIVIIAYYITKPAKIVWRNLILLCASLGFYAWGEPLFVYLMVITIIINWLMVLLMDKFDNFIRKVLCGLIIILDLGLLFIFKYSSFVSRNIAFWTKNDNFVINIALPIGISFFTFQMMSYVFDVYYKRTVPQKNLLYIMLYISLFPQLIAGPIVRYETIEKELVERKESIASFSSGIIRFTYGLGKKVLLANYLSVSADLIFQTEERSVLAAWLGAVCYTLQIYFDFSGYSDMAIGLGKIFGFHFPENFNYPYFSKSITEFWRRWHISLSAWFRDYVYIPMGGNRVSKLRCFYNLFVVWLLTGIWHGANWTFLIWGLFYFVFLLIEKLIGIDKSKSKRWYMHIYTMIVVVVAWVIFRADSIGKAIFYVGNMFGFGAKGVIDDLFVHNLKESGVLIICSILLSLPIIKKFEEKMNAIVKSIWRIGTSAVIFVLSLFACVASTYQPFIYFNF